MTGYGSGLPVATEQPKNGIQEQSRVAEQERSTAGSLAAEEREKLVRDIAWSVYKKQHRNAYHPQGEPEWLVNKDAICDMVRSVLDVIDDELTAAQEQSTPTLEDIIRGVEPDARTQRFLSVYQPWSVRGQVSRSLARAQEIAAAIVAEFGGSVDVLRFEKYPGEGVVRVETCGTQVSIFYDRAEAGETPCE